MENKLDEITEVDVTQIKPKEKWVYCRELFSGNYLCFENILYYDNTRIKLDEPIFSISVDTHIAIKTKRNVLLLDKEGKIIWQKKTKASAIAHFGEYLAFGEKKKLRLLNIRGEKILTKKVKGKILSIDLKDFAVVGSEKGVHAIDYSGKILWENYIGKVTLVKEDGVIAAALENELCIISHDGEMLWRQKFDRIIFDMVVENVIKVYLLGGEVVTLTLDGRITQIEKETYDYKFLPLPWLTVRKEFEKLNEMVKAAKKLKPKKIKKLSKHVEKLYKKEEYGSAYELLNKAMNDLKVLQMQVIIPKKIVVNRPFEVILKFYNFFDEVLENINVDLTDLEKYFEISEKLFDLPQIRKGMHIEKRVNVVPMYEGFFVVEINIKSNFGEIQKKFEVRVKRKRLLFSIFQRKEEKTTILDLLK